MPCFVLNNDRGIGISIDAESLLRQNRAAALTWPTQSAIKFAICMSWIGSPREMFLKLAFDATTTQSVMASIWGC
jgi:hypothetical protein